MQSHTRSVQFITVSTALEAVRVALEEGQKQGVNISVAICDPSMGLIAFLRGDGATPHSVETSRRKAQTAASTGKATGWMPDTLAVTLPMGTGNLLTNIPGGVPIRYGGTLVGALGIAGGTVDQDRVVAEETLKSIGADNI